MNVFIFKKYHLIFFLFFILQSCQKLEFSPYSTYIPEELKNQNRNSINDIITLNLGNSYKFAILSDIHTYYDELLDAVTNINNRNDVQFIVITGDLTERGMIDEFLFLSDILKNSEKPIIAVIGNHDYFNNGEDIYYQLFGQLNFSFIINNIKYVFFDSNIGANGYNVNFEWLNNQFNNVQNDEHLLLFAHISPYSFVNEKDSLEKQTFISLISNDILTFSFFGHEHYFYLNNQLKILISDCIQNRNYSLVTVNNNEIEIEQIFF